MTTRDELEAFLATKPDDAVITITARDLRAALEEAELEARADLDAFLQEAGA